MNSRSVPVAIALAVVLLAPACGQQMAQEEPPTPTPLPAPVVPTKPTYKVERGDVIRQVQFTGRISPVKEVDLFFRANGRVRSVNIERRAKVTEGQVLADLENAELERQLQQLELELDRSRIRLEEAQKGADSAAARAQMDLDVRNLQYAQARARDVTAQKALAEANLQAAAKAVERAQSAYDNSPFEGRGASSAAMNLEQATLNYQRAQAEYQLTMGNIVTDHEYELKILGKQVQQAQQGVKDAQQSVNQLLVNDVKSAQLNVDSLRARIGDAQIVAPFDGEIMSLSTSPGLAVEGYKPVMVIADPTSLEVSADPSTNILKDLTEGLQVDVQLVSVPEKPLKGEIRQLPYPYGGGGRTAEGVEAANADKSTRVTLDAATIKGVQFDLGDLVRVTAVLERKADALWLPPQAVRTFEGRKFVVVQEGEAQRRVDVKTGIQSEDRVEILEGLQEGQVVVAP